MVQKIDKCLLDTISDQAASSDRLRMNYNFHTALDAPAQRLLNALEPNTVIPIHRHQTTKETYIVLRGKIRIFIYNDDREVIEEFAVSPSLEIYGVDIPANTWHALKVEEKGTVIFEVKDGPYQPIRPNDLL